MFGSFKVEFMEEFAIILALFSTQFIYAVYAVFMGHLMAIGLNPLFLIILSNMSIFVFLCPIAKKRYAAQAGVHRNGHNLRKWTKAFRHGKKRLWPREFSLKLFGQVMLLSFVGTTVFQTLFLNGVKKTSPAVASSMPNLAPGFIFCMAWAFRFEKVNLRCIYSIIKIVGTLVCIVGAVTMSLLHDYSHNLVPKDMRSHHQVIDENKVIGTSYLLVAVFTLSGGIILQASTLGDFPAPISLSAVTAGLGAILTATMQLIEEHKLIIGSRVVTIRDLVGYALLSGVVSGSCSSIQSWIMKKKGPVFVSMFNPLGTVFSVILSSIAIGDSITIGSLIGMLLMFIGFYFVLWAKKKEYFLFDEESVERFDAKMPLLS